MTTHKHGNPIAQQYGLVISLLRSNDITRANAELATLNKQALSNRSAQHNAMLYTLTGQVKRLTQADDTLEFYRSAVQNFPNHRALIYAYADLLLQSHQAATAVKLLSEQITRHPSDIMLYELQARSYHQLKLPLQQHQAQAYSYAWQGNIHGAIEQLELAKQAGGSFYELSAIESDLRELREMLEAQAKK